MASITIMQGQKNLVFAALVANETGATLEEDGQWITISDAPELTIPRYCFSQAFDPDGRRSERGDIRLTIGWRSLLLNKQGHLAGFTDFEIVITDAPPGDKRPAFCLRFPDAEEKATAEEWAERMGFDSLTQYILGAVTAYNQSWREHAGYEDRRAEEAA